MIERLLLIIGLGMLLTACGSDFSYRIEGKVSNLKDSVVYAVFENQDVKIVDTVVCKKSGEFVFVQTSGDYDEATIYFNGKTKWITVFPEKGHTVKITGDISYPSMLQVKGGNINNRLSAIKKEIAPLLKEQADLVSQMNELDSPQINNSIEDTELASKLVNVNHQLMEHAAQTIQKYPTEEASVILIKRYFLNPDDTRRMDELLSVLSPELNEFYLVKYLKDYSTRAKRTALNAEAPGFEVKNIYGKSISLDSFPDKYLLLAFTAPWCDMCHTENLYLDEVASRYKTDQLEMLLVSLDENPYEIRQMLAKDTIAWNLVTDSAGQATRLIDLYNVNALPRCYLIDENGIIILKTDNGIEIKQALDSLLEK